MHREGEIAGGRGLGLSGRCHRLCAGRVRDRLVIYEIGADYLLGKVRDELRVEYIQLWPLDRSGAQAVAGSTPATGSARSSPTSSRRSAT